MMAQAVGATRAGWQPAVPGPSQGFCALTNYPSEGVRRSVGAYAIRPYDNLRTRVGAPLVAAHAGLRALYYL